MTITINPATAVVNGKDYYLELGTIGFTHLGREDHGIFTFLLDFTFGGSGQGAGQLSLNDPENFGIAVQGILDFFGCDWENLPGRRAFVLREERSDIIRGLMNEAQSKAIIFSDWFSEK